jgi:hypothetical protein
MGAPIAGGLLVQGRFPLDDKYWVNSKANLVDGLIYDGLFRWTRDTHILYVNENGKWKRIDTFDPVLVAEVIVESKDIAGLGLRDAIIWLANHRVAGTIPSPIETIEIIDVQGDDGLTITNVAAI